jgi:hypothetical protein
MESDCGVGLGTGRLSEVVGGIEVDETSDDEGWEASGEDLVSGEQSSDGGGEEFWIGDFGFWIWVGLGEARELRGEEERI